MTGYYWGNTQYFNPRQISGLVLWLDATDPAANGIRPSNGSSLAAWVDKSPQVNSGTASASNPIFNTNQINGLPAVTFTAVKNYNTGATGFPTGTTGRTWFGVVNSSNAAFGYMLNYGSFAQDQGWAPLLNGNFLYIDNTIDGGTSTTTTLVNSTSYLFIISYPGGGNVNSQLMTVGTTSQATTFFGGANAVNTGSALTPTVGAVNGIQGIIGNIAETVFYSGSLSAAKQALVSRYLSNKWGV